jgi:hypothetical protein
MTTKTQCTRHHTRHHLSHLPPGPTGIQQPNTIIPTTIVPLPPSPQGLIQPSLPLQQIPTLSTVQNHHYFSHNQTGHLGPASLVSLAHYKNRHSAHQMGPQHVYNQILIAQHTSDLTKAQNKRFAHLLHNLQITYPDAINLPCISVPPIPVTFAEIRSKFTEGPNSVWKNLPHPPIQTDVRGHCYVKISDVIEDFLAHGFLPMQPALHQSPDWVTDLSHAPQIVSGLQGAISRHGQQPFYYVAFKEWQDDYESHYARTERGSVWCKNITVIAEQGTPRHLCTYPIAFSNTDIPHHNLEKKLREDMNRFLDNNSPNLFYSSKLGKQIRVHAAMYVSLADQQERRPVTCTTAGNSNFHARFGYSINFKALLKKLPSCDVCRAYIREKLSFIYSESYILLPTEKFNLPECSDCYSWLYSIDKYPNVSYPPPDNYPASELQGDGLIRPFRLSFEKLASAGTLAADNIISGAWTSQQADSFLKVNCIISTIREDLIRRSSLRRQLNTAAGTPAFVILQEKINDLLAMEPTTLDPWEPPAIWKRGVELTQHLDAPMHLIFHGIIKGNCGLLIQWLKDRRSSSSFKRYFTGLLEPVASLSLEWCKVTPFSGSFAGWLAESYVGLSKISLWFWSGLQRVSEDPEYVPPTSPYQRWTGDQCKKWLQARNIPVKDMNAAELKASVAGCMIMEGGPPPIPPPTGGSIETVSQMMSSLDRMVRVLMSSCYHRGGDEVIMIHVIDFLNSFESFKPMNDDRKFPEWLTMYNFLCLLNLPDAIEQLGPLRLNYEGGSEGEGFIAQVKPLLSQGMRKNWQKNLSLRFYRNRAMKLVLRDAHVFIGSQNDAAKVSESSFTRKLFHKYKSWQQVQSNFARGLPISLVVLMDGFVGAVVADRDSWLFVPFRLAEYITTHWSLCYFRVQIFERDNAGSILRTVVNMGVEVPFMHVVLLLPLLVDQKYVVQDNILWTMVGSEYERLSTEGTLQEAYRLPVNLQHSAQALAAIAQTEDDDEQSNQDDGSETMDVFGVV